MNVIDRNGTDNEVHVVHLPHLGASVAFSSGRVIATVELKAVPDITLENYKDQTHETKLREWLDEVEIKMTKICTSYFNWHLLISDNNKKA